METTIVAQFYIVGLAIRTTNEQGQSATDIPKLWEQFFSRNIMGEIPNRIDDTLYCVYTNYEKDHTTPYTTILGCKVDNVDHVPDGLTSKLIEGGSYTVFTAKGKIADGIVFREWINIWNGDMERAYTSDFEVYGPKAQNPNDAAIDIFVGVNR